MSYLDLKCHWCQSENIKMISSPKGFYMMCADCRHGDTYRHAKVVDAIQSFRAGRSIAYIPKIVIDLDQQGGKK